MQKHLLVATIFLSGGTAAAQSSIVFAMDGEEFTLAGGGGLLEAGTIRPDETAIVTPGPGLVSASVFQSMVAQWAWIGDADQDGELLDASAAGPGDDTDAVFVRRFPAPPAGEVGPRDVFLSKEGDAGFGPEFEDGDVFRYAAQGVLEVFVSEAQLLDALGQSAASDLDLDAICQGDDGSLFVSFADAETVGGNSVDDGGLVWIDAASITYDANDNVSAIVPGSAVIVAQEADVDAWIVASGVATSVGGTPSSTFDLTALEIDPAGGTFTAPLGGAALPNLLFAWDGFSNDGAILSTAGGGSIATLNGVPLASASATTGAQIGLLPDSTGLGGLAGLAIIPARPAPVVCENDPTSLITSSTILWSRQEVSGATPGSPVVFFGDVGPSGTGAVLGVFPVPGFGGLVYGDGTAILLNTATADAEGFASQVINLPPSLVGTNANVVIQALDFGSLTFSTPAPIQFL